MSDLITRYLALPPGLTVTAAAELLGVARSTLGTARLRAGLRGPASGPRVHITPELLAEDAAIVARYIAERHHGTWGASKLMGITRNRLRSALSRAGEGVRTAAETSAAIFPPATQAPSKPVHRGLTGGEALPAGHPETWGVLGWGPWPGART